MAKITYICEGELENTARIHVDGKYIDSENFVGFVDSNIHAIQWDGSSGEIEYKDGTPNKTISDISSYGFEKKFTDEEIKEIESLQSEFNQITYQLGQLSISEPKLKLINSLKLFTNKYKEKFKELFCRCKFPRFNI